MALPIQLRPEETVQKIATFNRKMLKGLEILCHLREEDIRVGPTPKEEIHREDNVILYRYRPFVEQPRKVPLLIVYALVNRPYMIDLQEDRSLVRSLLKLGVDLYLIDWGYPARADRWVTLDDYLNGYLNDCVDVIRGRHDLESINLLGICQGGTFSLCYAALYPEKVKNLVTMVTPVDFHVKDGLLNVWAGCPHGADKLDVDLLVDAFGNIPGEFMNFGFLILRPGQLGIRKYLELIDILDDEDKMRNFLRMEKWIFDSPDQAGEAFRQFIKDFYQGNKLIAGELTIGGRRVDLAELTMPILNVYAEYDHLVPPASSVALGRYLLSADYTLRSYPVGHIGMYVSAKVQHDLPPMLAKWLQDRE